MSDTPVVTRIAPSPTGHLHIGTARTALFSFLYARHHGGTFIIRSEDTDRARSTDVFEAEILEGLEWLGFTADAFYRQSERAAIYRNFLESMIEQGSAYISKEESKNEPGKQVEVVRLKNPNTTITFTDEVRGDITFDTTELGDFVIARSLDDALYHFSVVVDDFTSGVTHVIRGEDHISNTPRQILIQQAIGAPRPKYAHLPLILAADRSKLSKRHGAVSLTEYRKEGFLKEAIVNYLALLGWNPGTDKEVFSLEELIQEFSLEKIQKGGAVFDREKFMWFNKEHIKRISDVEFARIVREWLPESVLKDETDIEPIIARILTPLRERITLLSDITREVEHGEFTFAFRAPDPTPMLLKWKKDEHVKDALPRLTRCVELMEIELGEFPTAEQAKAALWDYVESVGRGEVLWPLRTALTGVERSPDPFTAIAIVGRDEAIKRVKKACDTMLSA